MGKNNQWDNYTNEQLVKMLRKVLENNPDVKARNFIQLGLPSVTTYKRSILIEDTMFYVQGYIVRIKRNFGCFIKVKN